MSKLKKWLDEHPARIVAAVAISVGSTCSAVTTYFLSQRYELEKGATVLEYKGQIADLKAQLSSIERRAGVTQEGKYLDVKSMQIYPQEVRGLPSTFKDIDSGRLFVSVPVSEAWQFSITTEGDVFKTGPLKALIEAGEKDEKFKKLMSTKVFLWHPKPIARISFSYGSPKQQTTGELTPHVFVVRTTKEELVEKAAAYAAALNEEQKGQIREKKEKTTEQIVAKTVENDTTSSATDSDREDTTGLTSKLEQMYNGDAAGTFMLDAMARLARFSMISSDISYSINSAQKQLNVMYLDADIDISDATLVNSSDEYCTDGAGKTVSLHREQFFVSYLREYYFIETEVPTCGGRSNAFDWISQWLRGLRIVVRS